jgi:hypothetical protein
MHGIIDGFDLEDHDDRVAAIKRLIATLEEQIRTDFTHNEPMKARVKQYRKWLREIEIEEGLHGFC